MSISVSQIEKETGVTVHFHPNPEVFTKLTIGVMVAVGVIGLTALVVGVLAQLHIIHGIPSPGIDTMMGVGTGLSLMYGVVAIVLLHKHQKAVESLKQCLEDEASESLIESIKETFQSSHYEEYAFLPVGQSISSQARKVGCFYSIHIFEGTREEVVTLLMQE